MYDVSNQFKSGVYAPIRTAVARVTFDISDTSIQSDTITVTTTSETALSNKQQLINKKREPNYNFITWEPNRFKLDGSFSFADDNISNNKEIGFCSSTLSGADGSFSTYPTLTFQFNNNHSSMGLTITFDRLNNEYATDFNITAYNASNAVIDSVDVTGNTLALCTPTGQLYQYRKIVITIKKWSKPYRRCRVCEVDFGVVRVYEDNNLVKMSLIEELDLTTSTVPASEFKFTVDNADRSFNMLNPEGFYKFLQERQQVLAEIGIEVDNRIEFIQLGNYLLWEWTSDEGSLTASFTARTNLDLMSSFDYENRTAKANYTLYQFAIDIINICGVTNYHIDTALQSINTTALTEKKNCKDLLQMIAIAGCANIFVTRDNTIILKVNSNNIGTAVDAIDLDNMYQEPQIKLDKIIKAVEVTYFTSLESSAIVTVANSGITLGDVLKLEGNTLINTSARATAVANWILRQKNYRAIYTANWRGNPAHELNDVVSIEDGYGQNRNTIITRQELNYQGYLSGKTEARGITNVTS